MRSWRKRLEQFERDLEQRARAHPRLLRGHGPARRAGRPRLPLAGDELSAMAKLDPQVVAPPRVARLRPARRAWWSRRLRWCAPAPSSTARRRRDSASCETCTEDRLFAATKAPRPASRTSDVRRHRPRLELLAHGLRRHAASARSRPSSRSPCPNYERDPAPDYAVRELDPEPTGALPWQLLVRVLEPGAGLRRR